MNEKFKKIVKIKKRAYINEKMKNKIKNKKSRKIRKKRIQNEKESINPINWKISPNHHQNQNLHHLNPHNDNHSPHHNQNPFYLIF